MTLDTSKITQAVAKALDKLEQMVPEDEVEYGELRIGGVMVVVSVDYDTPEHLRDERWAEGTLTYVFVEPENPRTAHGMLKAIEDNFTPD